MASRIEEAGRPSGFPPPLWLVGLGLLLLLMVGFVSHSAGLGLAGLTRDLTGESPFYEAEAPVATAIVFLHMITGAALILLAPLQLVGPIRRRWPRLHRWSGRTMVVLGLATGIGGLHYVAARGTTGGPFMDLSSAVYGILVVFAAAQTYRLGRARRWEAHRRWGWRFAVLAIASWLYRVHYVIWDLVADGAGTTPDMTGPFDRFQAWAFYLSYLALLELWFLREGRRLRAASRSWRRAAAPSLEIPRPKASIGPRGEETT